MNDLASVESSRMRARSDVRDAARYALMIGVTAEVMVKDIAAEVESLVSAGRLLRPNTEGR